MTIRAPWPESEVAVAQELGRGMAAGMGSPTPAGDEPGLATSALWGQDHRLKRIAEAEVLEDVIAVLAECGDELTAAASRLQHLATVDDDEPPIRLDSARALAIFLIRSRGQLGRPRIGVDPGGRLLVEYGVARSGVLAVEFLSVDLVRYAAVSDAATAGVTARRRISGTVSISLALAMVRLFMVNIE